MRKTDDDTWPEELPFNELDRLTWLRPDPDADFIGGPRWVEVLDALNELFKLVTPYQDWLDALHAKQKLIIFAGADMRSLRAGKAKDPKIKAAWTAMSREARSLARQETRRRQKFDRAIKNWANTYGLLGVGNVDQGDYVPDIFRAVTALRAWALPESGAYRGRQARVLDWRIKGYPAEQSSREEPLRMRHEELRINALAGRCGKTRRHGETYRCAPTLWAAMCLVVRDADDLDVQFGMCGAADCYNPFVKYGKRAHCSKRCANRAREQRLRLEQTLSQ